MTWIITCDRASGFARAVVWKGKELHDIYVDRLDTPDMTGAVVGGRVARVQLGQKAAWVDAGLSEKIYIEPQKPLKTGTFLTLSVKTTMGEGKAWQGVVLEGDAPQALGIVTPPPPVWLRALHSVKSKDVVALRFGAREDYEECLTAVPSVQAVLCHREPVHPELDEIMDALCARVVPLVGGASLMVEQTAALVAIDVNAEITTNPVSANLIAVREAARQIRLRNLSGIIIIDCLKMAVRADISKVVNAFERVAASDPCAVRCIGINKLGLLELTRERRGPSLSAVMRCA